MGRFGAGQPARRVEDRRFLTGAGRYTSDIDLAGQAAAVMVRSAHAHARVLGVDTAAAARASGVVGVFTAADLAADRLGDIPALFAATSRDGSPMRAPRRPVLAADHVAHAGEAVAMVVAETAAQARDAAELVLVDYAPLQAVATGEAALRPGAPEIWPGIAGNLCFDWEMGDETAVAAAFAAAARVVSLRLVNNRVIPTAMEPRSAIGDYDAQADRLTLYTGTQNAHSLRDWLCRDVLHLPRERLRVVAPDVGGGFGMRIFLFPEHALVLWAARRLRRPVRWVGERSESFLADTHGRDHLTEAALALGADGRILAVRADTIANLGAYVSQFGAFIPTQAGSGMLTGVYRIPALHVRVRGALTNTAPVDAYRGAGRPEAAYVIERLVDAAAREMGLAPDEMRRRNFIPPDAMPFRTAGGKTYDSGDFARNMADAMARADWAGFPARRKAAAQAGRWRGIGMATYIEACGGGPDEGADLCVDEGGGVTLLIGTQSSGQGHETAYAQMVADALGVAIERVRMVQGDTDRVDDGRGTGGSRSLPVGGGAVAAAAEALLARTRGLAAQVLGAAEDQLDYAAGAWRLRDSNRFLDLGELARAAGPAGLSAAARFQPPAATYPNGCHICEVEIDPETGAVAVLRYTIVDDFGVVLNPLLLEGQVQGGTAQGIGQALLEGAVYDDDSARLLTGSLLDYALPRAAFLPSFDFATNEIPCRTHPLGVKGAGEAGSIGAPPAVINAVIDALAPLGIRHIDMPATPLRIWRLIQSTGGTAAS